MKYKDFTITTRDGVKVFTAKWMPEKGKPKAAIQIAHGMAEHVIRYAVFAKALVDAGFVVYGNDHRGHGKTAGLIENVGYFADENGFYRVVDDMHELTNVINDENPDLPIFLFGHSMGSFLSKNYIALYGKEIKGVILSGTGGNPGLLGIIGMLVAKWECKRKGRRTPSALLNYLSFGNFNKPFRPNRTDFDWLSRDEAEVDKYVEDPYCGGVFTAGFFLDLLTGIKESFAPENTKKVPQNLPILILSGDKDPVGNSAKGVRQVFKSYQNVGIKDVNLKLYEDGRHEMLNETNKEEVHKDIIAWLNDRMSRQ